MGGTDSVVRKFHIEIAWAIFASANLVAMFVFPAQVTVPFHFIWISLTLVYGYRTWEPRPTLIVLGIVMFTTTFGEVNSTRAWAELSEIPLMAAMFLAMVWHARRRQRAIEDLRIGAERERDFLRDASHHLRTPITIAVGHAELVRHAVEDPRTVDDVDVVLDELHNLGEIANRILMLATADHPEYLRPEDLALDAFVQRIGDRWSTAADRDWQIDCGSTVVIEADRDQIERALDAIVENSVNHTTAADSIQITTSTNGGTVAITVTDTGSGIPRAHLPHVFERFFGTNSGSRRGTGLGLAIVQSVAEAHGGKAAITSEEGVGTIVTLTLPVGADRGVAAATLLARERA
jgi:signal transduction histidine kinase